MNTHKKQPPPVMQILLDLVHCGKAPRVRQTRTTICYFCLQSSNFPPDESLIAAKQWQLLLRQELTASSPGLHLSFHSSCMLNGCLKPRSSSLHIKTNMPFLCFHLNYSNWREVSGSKWREKKKESENEEPLREHSWCQRDTHFPAPSVKSYLELFLSFSILIPHPPHPRFYHLTSYTKWQKPLELTASYWPSVAWVAKMLLQDRLSCGEYQH